MSTHTQLNQPTPSPVIAQLRDGTIVSIRHVMPGDGPALATLMERLSARSRRMRFFTGAANIEHAADWAASADGHNHLGLVAIDPAGEVVGHAAACRLYGPRAEIGIEIDETHRHLGLATLLIAQLAREAERAGISTFLATVLPDNHDMLAVLHDAFNATGHTDRGQVDIEFPTSAWTHNPYV
jgi:L-amino acid N-acyltransferase YncA